MSRSERSLSTEKATDRKNRRIRKKAEDAQYWSCSSLNGLESLLAVLLILGVVLLLLMNYVFYEPDPLTVGGLKSSSLRLGKNRRVRQRIILPYNLTHVGGSPGLQQPYEEGHPPVDVYGSGYSSRETEERVSYSPLPSFSTDLSEFFFSALIERSRRRKMLQQSSSSESWTDSSPLSTPALTLTTFMLSQFQLRYQEARRMKILGGNDSLTYQRWQRVAETSRQMKIKYTPAGQRRHLPPFHCLISHAASASSGSPLNESFSYTVRGEFVPNRLTKDVTVNRRLDIMRCPLQIRDWDIVKHHVLKRDSLSVQILRDGEELINFLVPWESRSIGYLMDFHHPSASRLPPWPDSIIDNFSQSAAPSSRIDPATAWATQTVHLCIPTTGRGLSRQNLALYLEFVAHHLLIGVSHIYFPTSWSASSEHYRRLQQVLRSFIAEGKLTIISQSEARLEYNDDDADEAAADADPEAPWAEAKNTGRTHGIPYVVHGAMWEKSFVWTMQANACLYYSKGVADFLLILDVDQFLVPREHHGTESIHRLLDNQMINDEIETLDERLFLHLQEDEEQWRGGAGWADRHKHPLCFLRIPSQPVLASKQQQQPLQQQSGWIGRRFAHGSETSLLSSNSSSGFSRKHQDRYVSRSISFPSLSRLGTLTLSFSIFSSLVLLSSA